MLKLFLSLVLLSSLLLPGCTKSGPAAEEVVVYCGVDEPFASQIFADFEKQTGIHIAPQYDIEASKTVGLAGKLEAERDYPRADVWWGSEAFVVARLAEDGVLAPYAPPNASDIPPEFKDPNGFWTGVGLRARVLAVGNPPPPFEIHGIEDLADPRLKNRIAMARPTAGATGAHVAALYVLWGPQKAAAFFHRLHDNGIALLGGNAEVADQVGAGVYALGLTDSDSITSAQANGGKLTQLLPDQSTFGALAMPTTVCLVRGSRHANNAKRLIDYLVSKQAEQKLISLGLVRWSVRTGPSHGIKAMKVDYRVAALIYPQALREASAILDGRM